MSIYKFNSIFHQVDISLLRHFFAIATFGGFSKASEATGVSQPALSLGLQKLEKSLGVSLIDRSTRPFELTKAGLTLLTFCQRFQGSFESVVEALGGTEISVQKKLRIGTALSIGIGPLDVLCASIEKLDEKFELELLTLNSYQLLNDVFEGRLDAALIPDDIYDNRLKFTSILKDQIIFIVGKKHQDSFHRKDWKEMTSKIPLVTFPRETPMRTLTDKLCISEGVEFNTIYSVNNIESLKCVVEKNRGGAFVMRSLVESELKEKIIFEVKTPLKMPKSGISLVTRVDESSDANSKLILNLLKQK